MEELKNKYIEEMTKKAKDYAASVIKKELWMDDDDVEEARVEIANAFLQGANAARELMIKLYTKSE